MKNKFFKKSKDLIFPKVDLSGVKAVLTDLDNTLYFLSDEVSQEALHKVYLLFYKEMPMSEEEFLRYHEMFRNERLKRFCDTPEAHNRLLVFQRIAEHINAPSPFILAQKAQEIFFRFIFRNISCNKKALAFLRKCKRHKIPVCVVTDALSNIQIEKIKALKIEKYISFIVSDDETGHDKPHLSMFQTALAKLDKTPEEVIMIGDDTARDIDGANKMQIKSYQVILACNKEQKGI